MDPESWQKLKDLVYDALQLPASEREGFVRERLGGSADGDLAIAMLQDYQGDGQHLLPSLQSDRVIPLPLPDVDDLDDIQPGTHIGQYVVLDRLGRGGEGQVFLARDPELRRRVALKCLIGSHQHSLGFDRGRILAEAIATAAVTHPNVAPVYHVVEQGARAFIVMEYVEGQTLASHLKRRRLPIDDVVRIGRQLAAALAAAHAQGVIHGDLKPANVQITPDGTAKVLDFGVARALRTVSSAASDRSTHGAEPVAGWLDGGTPPYMAPEQLLGHRSDERADLYSLGVVLFEMATGRRPYRASEREELLQEHQRTAPRADAIDPKVPRSLADLIARALDRDVLRRFQTAVEILGALAALEAGQNRPTREPIRVVATRVGLGMVTASVTLLLLGLINTIGFNTTMGRDGVNAVFGSESPTAYMIWGYRSVVPTALYVSVTLIVVLVVRFMTHVLCVIPLVSRLIAVFRNAVKSIFVTIRLDEPRILAQALLAGGVFALITIVWRFRGLMIAFLSVIDTSPVSYFRILEPGNPERGLYRYCFDLLILALGAGLLKVWKLSRTTPEPDARGSIAALFGLFAIAVVLNDLPYRVFWFSEAERIDYGGTRCYVLGRHEESWLVHCPDVAPPRNRVVRANDPSISRHGVIESVFTPPVP